MAFIDYYKIMGISKDTPQKDIKAAYKKRAKQFHPDLHPDDPKAKAKFQALNEAYDVLNDPEKRAKYDQYGEHWKMAGMGGGATVYGVAGRLHHRTNPGRRQIETENKARHTAWRQSPPERQRRHAFRRYARQPDSDIQRATPCQPERKAKRAVATNENGMKIRKYVVKSGEKCDICTGF